MEHSLCSDGGNEELWELDVTSVRVRTPTMHDMTWENATRSLVLFQIGICPVPTSQKEYIGLVSHLPNPDSDSDSQNLFTES